MKTIVGFVCAFLFQGLVFSPVLSGELILTGEEKQWLADHPIIRLSPDPAFPPIEEVNGRGEYVGMAADYMALIEKKMGFKFTVVTFPSWKRVMAEAKRKNVDVLAAVTRSPKREKFLNFARPHIRADGKEGLEKVRTEAPDAVILDLMMPVMGGLTFLKKLRKDPSHSGLPVFVLTGKALSDDESEVLSELASAVLLKESAPDQLTQLLGSIFNLADAQE